MYLLFRGKDATVHSPGPKTYTELGRANVENGVRETSLCRGKILIDHTCSDCYA